METKVIAKSEYSKLYDFLNQNHVVGFPTETVYGLGFRYDSEQGLIELGDLKNRPINKPITMMLYDIKEIDKYALYDDMAKRVIEKYMPGSITIILQAKDDIPKVTSFNQKTIGIRIPTNDVALAILKGYKIPLLVTSANISNNPPLQKADEVYQTFKGKLCCLIDEDASCDLASTIVDLSGDEIKLIREGAIPFNDIKKTWEGCL